jgi:hypothetical protein
MNRSIKANPMAANVRNGISSGSGRAINLDLQQMIGALGDKLTVGRLVLNGKEGRLEIYDETGTMTGMVGNLDV